MRKIIILLLTLFYLSSFAQNDNPKLQALLDANENYTYLKDFEVELEPGGEHTFAVILSKGTLYALSAYQEYTGQFHIEIKKDKSEKELMDNLHQITIKDNSMNMEYKIKETGAYKILVQNKSDKKASTVVLLSFIERFNNDEPKVEIVKITSSGMSQKEKDFFEGKSTNPEIETEEIFFIVEDMPKFNGKSSNEFRNFVQENLKYPQEAIDNKIEGRVFVQFIVSKDGYIKDAKVARGVHPSLDQEALRIIYSSPRWEPGKQRGQAVNVSYTFPVIFKLSEKWTIINPEEK